MMYNTVEDCIRTNGNRHLERAFNHLYYGRPNRYWQGSLAKALKNYQRADSLKLDPFIQGIVDRMSRSIADNIMNGSSNSGLGGLFK